MNFLITKEDKADATPTDLAMNIALGAVIGVVCCVVMDKWFERKWRKEDEEFERKWNNQDEK